MSQAVKVIRDAGFNGPIAIPCINYANECAAYDGENDFGGSWLQDVPGIDPDHQLVAEVHIYSDEDVCGSGDASTGSWGVSTACFPVTLSPILQAGYPIIAAETGNGASGDCSDDSASQFLPWYQANGMGWLSFAWDEYPYCTLFVDQSGETLTQNYDDPTPDPGYGTYVEAFDQAQPG